MLSSPPNIRHRTRWGSCLTLYWRVGNGLYDRLKDHYNSVRKNDSRNTFSWFGFKVAQKDGTLGDEPDYCGFNDLVSINETIFIEALLPRLNMQAGSGAMDLREMGLYSQS